METEERLSDKDVISLFIINQHAVTHSDDLLWTFEYLCLLLSYS